jgi:hypothetical protein
MSGDSFEWIPENAGEQPYYCMLHTWMIGTIIVQEAAAEEQIQESEPVVEDIESEEPVVGINPNSSYQISDQIRSSELDNFKITLEDLRELWSWKNYKLISEKEYVNNAEGGIKKNVQSFYNNEGIWKSNVKLEIFQFDSYQNAKNYFEGHNYSNSEK